MPGYYVLLDEEDNTTCKGVFLPEIKSESDKASRCNCLFAGNREQRIMINKLHYKVAVNKILTLGNSTGQMIQNFQRTNCYGEKEIKGKHIDLEDLKDNQSINKGMVFRDT